MASKRFPLSNYIPTRPFVAGAFYSETCQFLILNYSQMKE